jgi:hypothetical protein
VKRCKDCGAYKDESEYYVQNGKPLRFCKACHKVRYGNRGKGRAFGVEFEITYPDAYTVERALISAGVPVRNRGCYGRTDGTKWEIKTDCSVNGHGVEVVSPKLKGKAGFEELEKVCAALNSVAAKVDRSCGLHVHHDFRRKPKSVVYKSVLAFVERQFEVMKMMAPSRRENYNYCPMWEDYHIQRLRGVLDYGTAHAIGPRGVLNMAGYPRRGSIELRCHGGTTNYDKIAAWVRFGQAFFKAAEDGTDLPDTVEGLAGMVDAADSEVLLRFEQAVARRNERRAVPAVQDGDTVQGLTVGREWTAIADNATFSTIAGGAPLTAEFDGVDYRWDTAALHWVGIEAVDSVG